MIAPNTAFTVLADSVSDLVAAENEKLEQSVGSSPNGGNYLTIYMRRYCVQFGLKRSRGLDFGLLIPIQQIRKSPEYMLVTIS